jgi:hypothetical protein
VREIEATGEVTRYSEPQCQPQSVLEYDRTRREMPACTLQRQRKRRFADEPERRGERPQLAIRTRGPSRRTPHGAYGLDDKVSRFAELGEATPEAKSRIHERLRLDHIAQPRQSLVGMPAVRRPERLDIRRRSRSREGGPARHNSLVNGVEYERAPTWTGRRIRAAKRGFHRPGATNQHPQQARTSEQRTIMAERAARPLFGGKSPRRPSERSTKGILPSLGKSALTDARPVHEGPDSAQIPRE